MHVCFGPFTLLFFQQAKLNTAKSGVHEAMPIPEVKIVFYKEQKNAFVR